MKKRLLAIFLSAMMALSAVPVNAGTIPPFTSGGEKEPIADEGFTDGMEETGAERPALLEADEDLTPALTFELLEGGEDNLIECNYIDGFPLRFKIKITASLDTEPTKRVSSGGIDITLPPSITLKCGGVQIGSNYNLTNSEYNEVNGKYILENEVEITLNQASFNNVSINGSNLDLTVRYYSGNTYANIETVDNIDTGIDMLIHPYEAQWWGENKPVTDGLRHDYISVAQEPPTGETGESVLDGQLQYHYVEKTSDIAPDVTEAEFFYDRRFRNLKEDTEYWIWKKGDLDTGYIGNISPARAVRTKSVSTIDFTGTLSSVTVGNELDLSSWRFRFNYADGSNQSGYSVTDLSGSNSNCMFYLGDEVITANRSASIADNGKQLKLVFTKTNGTKVECSIGTLSVVKNDQDPITVTNIPTNLTFGDAAFELGAEGGSGTGTALTYEISEGQNVLRVTDGKLEIIGAGTAKVVVTKAGDDSYKSVSADPVEITVNRAQPTIQLSDDWFYTGGIYLRPVITGVSGGVQPSGTVTYTWYEDREGTILLNGDGSAPSGTGTYYVKAYLAEDGNYLSAESNIARINIRTYIPAPSPTPEPIPDNYPDGSIRNPDGSIETPNGTVIEEDGTIILPDGSRLEIGEDGSKPSIDKENNVTDINGTIIGRDGTIILPGENRKSTEDDTWIEKGDGQETPVYNPDTVSAVTKEGNKVTLPSGIVVEPETGSQVATDGTITEPDGTVIRPDGTIEKTDGTIIDPDGTTHNPDGSVQSPDGTYLIPATPMLERAEVYAAGNQVKAVLAGESAGAEGYDYVISENVNCIYDKDYLLVSKNIEDIETYFRYVPEGTYYVYCHAWIKDDNGKKIFGAWSNYRIVEVTATTPQTPRIQNVKINQKAKTITLTYSRCQDASGYDIILGSRVEKVNGEKRPVDYGKRVKKITNGNTVTVTLRNAKRGTYYMALHAWNRTSEDGTKVFSPWSNIKKIVIR